MRVLLIEDDQPFAATLRRGLTQYGYDVDWVRTGGAALTAPPGDFVLLARGLPDMDGLDVCRKLRATGSVPVIMLSDCAEESDRIVSLELGADDCVSKQTGVREVIARMRAVLRRARPAPDDPHYGGHQPTRHGRLALDQRSHRVYVDTAEVTLTPREFALLTCLAEVPGVLLTREAIMSAVWGGHWFGSTKTLDAHIACLRRKLGDAVTIETVRGVGFRLTAAA